MLFLKYLRLKGINNWKRTMSPWDSTTVYLSPGIKVNYLKVNVFFYGKLIRVPTDVAVQICVRCICQQPESGFHTVVEGT